MTNGQSFAEKYILFSDFDGTITQKDSNVELVRLYGNDQIWRDEALFVAGKATNREIILRHYGALRLSPEVYYNVLFAIPIDHAFAGFYSAVKDAGGSITVLTGSAAEGVRNYLGKNGFGDIEVYGNRMKIEDGIIVMYSADETGDTLCGKGLCALCKSSRLSEARGRAKQVVYIGDGLTDLCAARHADLLFAKSTLAAYCEKNNIPFVPFNDFSDIHKYFFNA